MEEHSHGVMESEIPHAGCLVGNVFIDLVFS